MENQVARRFLDFLQAEWWLWIMWVLATTVVGFLGVVGLMFGAIGGVAYTSARAVVFGVLLGTVQWLLLRKRVPRAGRWVLATAVGWIVCALVNLGAGRIVPQLRPSSGGLASQLRSSSGGLAGYYVSMAVISVLSGTMIGTAQWMFLRKRVYRAGWWVWATAMSWGVGWGLGLGIRSSLLWVILLYPLWGILSSPLRRMISTDRVVTLFFTAIGVAVGIAVGAITGSVLIVLLRHPISSAPEPGQESNTR